MPWYISPFRVGCAALYGTFGVIQCKWIWEAEDRYRRSISWEPTVGIIRRHSISYTRLGSSLIDYEYEVKGIKYTGNRFKSGGISNEEMLSNPSLLGNGTEVVIYYNPHYPAESAINIQSDRSSEVIYGVGIFMCFMVAVRAVRNDTVVPNLYYRVFGSKRILDHGGLTPRGSTSWRR
eukprot:Tbor_TRINITY_DN5836_c1_g8::TRINITY_DN5836_c1_g8_i1::g.7085::m.7085